MTHKLLKKIIGNFGYKLIEKNVSKNDRLISSKSYLKIDWPIRLEQKQPKKSAIKSAQSNTLFGTKY